MCFYLFPDCLLVRPFECVPHSPELSHTSTWTLLPVRLWVCAWGRSAELLHLLHVHVCFQQLVTKGKARDAGMKEARVMWVKTPQSNERVRQTNAYGPRTS